MNADDRGREELSIMAEEGCLVELLKLKKDHSKHTSRSGFDLKLHSELIIIIIND